MWDSRPHGVAHGLCTNMLPKLSPTLASIIFRKTKATAKVCIFIEEDREGDETATATEALDTPCRQFLRSRISLILHRCIEMLLFVYFKCDVRRKEKKVKEENKIKEWKKWRKKKQEKR